MRGFLSFLIDSLLPVCCVACGRDIALSDEPPPVLGAAAGGSAFDSELWCDATVLNQVYNRPENIFQSATVRLESVDAFAMFKPFMIDNEYLYRSDNVRALMSVVKEKEKHLLPWYPEKLDWYDYWLNVHFPGMKKWVLPTLEEELKIQERRSHT